MSTQPIAMPYSLQNLTVEPGRIGSPGMPVVRLTERENDGSWLNQFHLTPDGARELATQLIAAAEQTEQRA